MNDSDKPAPAPENANEVTDHVVGLLEAEAKAQPAADKPEAKAEGAEPPAESEDAPAEPTTAESEPAEQPEQPKYRVKINGVEQEVPLNELLNGYSRQQDYSAKTAEVARKAEALAAQERQFQASLQQQAQAYAQSLAVLEALNPVLAEANTIDWSQLAQENPAEYVAKKQQVEDTLKLLHQTQQAKTQLELQARGQKTARESELLAQKMPEWADPTKRQQIKTEMKQYLTAQGYQDAELDHLVDHRTFTVAYKAMQYDRMMAKQKEVAAKKVAPQQVPTVRPKAQGQGQADARAAALRKTALRSGKPDDVVAYVHRVLGE